MACFVVVSGFINFARDRFRGAQIAEQGIEITRKLTELIGSLGEISADQYKMWKVDFYAAQWKYAASRRFPWVARRTLRRISSVVLVASVLFGDTSSRQRDGILLRVFENTRDEFWVTPRLEDASLPHDMSWVDRAADAELVRSCGLLRAFPVASSVDGDCIGVLAVHVEPQFALQMISTMGGEQCANKIHHAAMDLHRLVFRS